MSQVFDLNVFAQAAADGIKSNEVAVKANELALEGVRAENSVGTRTILDVLDAEQELLNSQVLLVTARRDFYGRAARSVSTRQRACFCKIDAGTSGVIGPICLKRMTPC